MLIDGELVGARSGRTLDNVNPATEEVLGTVSDAGHDDVAAAIAAARRAFDETDWTTNRPLRKRCLLELQAAIGREREGFRAEIVAEAGAPIGITGGLQVDATIDGELAWPIAFMDEFEWERELPANDVNGTRSWRRVAREPVGVVAAIVPWNFPLNVAIAKVVPAPAHRQRGHPQGRAADALERHSAGPAGRRADGAPARCPPGGRDL
jgi:aldehyde dehydrogenase (NAD+)